MTETSHAIITKDADRHTLSQLEKSRFFMTYADAFEKVAHYKLSLKTEVFGHENVFPIIVGKRHLGFLVAEQNSPEENAMYLDILHTFSWQLGQELNRIIIDEANRATSHALQALQYLRLHINQKVSLEEVADTVGLCPFKLSRLFKESVGITMTEYLGRLRVELARRRLLDQTRPVEEIAKSVGFGSLSQFNRTFQKFSGESPTEYRFSLREIEHCKLTSA